MQKRKISAVIFDMDGVIFDTESLWKKSFERSNGIFGVDLDETYRQSICGKSEIAIRDELRSICPNVDADEYRDSMLRYVNSEIERGAFDMKASFVPFMDHLKRNGYKTALATSSHKKRAEMLFKMKGLNIGAFDAMVFSEDVGAKSKPDPLIFLLAAQKLGLEPSECMVVEDSLNGIEAAVRGGFVAVMAIDLIKPNAFCLDHAIIVDDLTQIISHLEER